MDRSDTSAVVSARPTPTDWEAAVRAALGRAGRLTLDPQRLDRDADLLDAGLTSQAAVEVVFSLEDEFGFELDDSMITRSNLSTIASMASMLASTATGA